MSKFYWSPWLSLILDRHFCICIYGDRLVSVCGDKFVSGYRDIFVFLYRDGFVSQNGDIFVLPRKEVFASTDTIVLHSEICRSGLFVSAVNMYGFKRYTFATFCLWTCLDLCLHFCPPCTKVMIRECYSLKQRCSHTTMLLNHRRDYRAHISKCDWQALVVSLTIC